MTTSMDKLRTVWESVKPDTKRKAIRWWVVCHIIITVLTVVQPYRAPGDPIYWFGQIYGLFHGVAPSQVLPEYPTPVLWVLSFLFILSFGNLIAFGVIIILVALATDLVFSLVLWRAAKHTGVDPSIPLAFWCLVTLALGGVTYFRLDLLSAMAGACAALALLRASPAISGVSLGIGSALKLWPSVLLPAALGNKKQLLRTVVACVLTGGGLAVISWAYAGWDRLFSPLHWQSGRGLQIESVWASPLMLDRLFHPASYDIANSAYHSWEITGPGVPQMLQLSDLSTIVGYVIIAGLYVTWFALVRQRTIHQGLLLMTIATVIMIVTSRAFSPQYIIWFACPVAALFCLPTDRRLRRISLQAAVWTLVAAVLTQIEYPTLYANLLTYDNLTWFVTTIVVIRNLLLLAFLIWSAVHAIRSIVASHRQENLHVGLAS